MAVKKSAIYLYLTLACFFGIIAIFILDGYSGLYETIFITTGEGEQRIESEAWRSDNPYWPSGIAINRDEKVFFRYEVDNRRFTGYEADIEVSVSRMQNKVSDVLSQHIAAGAFNKVEIDWVIDTAEIVPPGAPPEQSLDYTLRIKRGEVERNILLYINPSPVPAKPMPVPPRLP